MGRRWHPLSIPARFQERDNPRRGRQPVVPGREEGVDVELGKEGKVFDNPLLWRSGRVRASVWRHVLVKVACWASSSLGPQTRCFLLHWLDLYLYVLPVSWPVCTAHSVLCWCGHRGLRAALQLASLWVLVAQLLADGVVVGVEDAAVVA